MKNAIKVIIGTILVWAGVGCGMPLDSLQTAVNSSTENRSSATAVKKQALGVDPVAFACGGGADWVVSKPYRSRGWGTTLESARANCKAAIESRVAATVTCKSRICRIPNPCFHRER